MLATWLAVIWLWFRSPTLIQEGRISVSHAMMRVFMKAKDTCEVLLMFVCDAIFSLDVTYNFFP